MKVESRRRLPRLALLALLVGCAPIDGPAGGGDGSGDGGDVGKGDDLGPGDGGDTLAVWTWNLEQFPKSARVEAEVVAALERRPADIVGFQEIDDVEAFDDLVRALPNWGGFPGRLGFGTHVAIAYRRDRVQVVAIEDLFEDDSFAFPRPPLAVTFEIRERPELGTLTVVVVHLKAQIDEGSEDRRRAGVERLEQWIYERRQGPDAAVIAIGDWNDELGDTRADNVFLPFLDRPSNYDALTAGHDELGAYSYIPFRRLIDHAIATREAAEQFPIESVEVIEMEREIDEYRDEISDHRPVVSLHQL